jgi:glutamine amidotransferase
VSNLDDSPIRDEPLDDTPVIAVLDYSSGQAESVAETLTSTGADVYVTSNWAMCIAADGLIVPGGSSTSEIPLALMAARAAEMIDARLLANKSVLVIGNAFNVLFESGDQATNVFNQWPGYSEKLPDGEIAVWRNIEIADDSKLLNELANVKFLFENKEAVFDWKLDSRGPLHAPRVSWASAERKFIAAIENGPLLATQFRPELSGSAGQRLLQNWVKTL